MTPHDSEHNRPDRMEDIRRDLYSRTPKRQSRPHNVLSDDEEPEVVRDWNAPPPMKQKQSKAANYFFWGTLLFLVVAAGLVYLSIETGLNIISSENVEVSIELPENIDSGDVVPIEIEIKNENDIEIRSPAVLIEFPEGARDPEKPLEVVRRQRIDMETVAAGGSAMATTSVRLYGEPDEEKQIRIIVEYRVPDSAATFTAEAIKSVEIDTAPFVMRINAPEMVATGEVVELEVALTSHSEEEVSDIVVVAEYPSGFIYTSAVPAPSLDTNVWNISSIEADARKTIKIEGRIAAQEGDERVVRINAGLPDPLNEKRVGIPFAQAEHTFSVEESVLPISLLIEGERKEQHSVQAGDEIDIELLVENRGEEALGDVAVSMVLTGNLFIPDTIEVMDGQYRGTDKTIVWNGNTSENLREIAPGDAVRVRARARVWESEEIQSQSIDSEMDVLARVEADTGGENVSSEVENLITLVPAPHVSLDVEHDGGPFENEGPFPAVEDERTKFTVKIEAESSVGEMGAVRLRAELPSYVEWLENISPSREEQYVTYDPIGSFFEWDVGDLSAGTGRTLYIQLAATPERTPATALLENINVTAEDLFSGTVVEEDFAPLSIEVRED